MLPCPQCPAGLWKLWHGRKMCILWPVNTERFMNIQDLQNCNTSNFSCKIFNWNSWDEITRPILVLLLVPLLQQGVTEGMNYFLILLACIILVPLHFGVTEGMNYFLIFILACVIICNINSCFTFPPRSPHFKSQFCIQLKSFYQLAGHDIISHFLYLMTSVTRILTTFQIISSTILGDKSCENVYEEGITYFGEQVKMMDSVLTREECAAICSKEAACAFWSHLASQSECRIWSSDVARSENKYSKGWVSGKKCA